LNQEKQHWERFDVTRAGDHFYLVENTGGGNIGLIVVDKSALVIDSGWFPRISAELIATIEDRLGCRPEILVNTHYHSDHTFGNQSFDVPIMAVEQSRELMDQCRRTHWSREEIEKFTKDDPTMAVEWENLEITPPTETFDEKKEFMFHGLPLVFERVGGHSPDSTMIYCAPHKIIYTGDLVFSQRYPTLLEHDGDLDGLLSALARLLYMDIETIFPGHGPACDKVTVQNLIDYWGCLMSAAKSLTRLTASEDDAVRSLAAQCRLDPVPYDDFRHQRNIRTVWKKARQRAQTGSDD